MSARTILDRLNDHPLPGYARRTAREIDDAIREERDSWGRSISTRAF